MNLWHSILKILIPSRHQVDNLFTEDVWHRGPVGEIHVYLRTIKRECTCGHIEVLKTIKR